MRATRTADTATVTRAVEVAPNPTVTRTGRMPDAHGLTLRDALFLLENRGLKVRTSGTGRVREQSVAPGEVVKRGAVVSLALAPTAALAAAPMALPEPTHTEIAENTLLVPAEHEAASRPARGPRSATAARPGARPESTPAKDKAAKTKSAKPTAPRSEKKSNSPKKTKPADIRTTQRPAAQPAVAKASRGPKSA